MCFIDPIYDFVVAFSVSLYVLGAFRFRRISRFFLFVCLFEVFGGFFSGNFHGLYPLSTLRLRTRRLALVLRTGSWSLNGVRGGAHRSCVYMV